MLNTFLSQFVTAWTTKANKYKDGKLNGAFDRFFSLFVPFNTLYQAATDKMIAEGRISDSDATDRRMATEHTIAFVEAVRLRNHLRTHCTEELDKIVELIEDGTFYVSTDRHTGEADRQSDFRFIEGIKSSDETLFCNGILNLLYLTRCNMFHGSKEFKHIQINLLRPMNEVLNQIIVILLSRLRTEA